MSEKESGAEVSHSRLAEVSGFGSQQYLYKKQFKSKKGMSILHDWSLSQTLLTPVDTERHLYWVWLTIRTS